MLVLFAAAFSDQEKSKTIERGNQPRKQGYKMIKKLSFQSKNLLFALVQASGRFREHYGKNPPP
jgi:hypothetical protein